MTKPQCPTTEGKITRRAAVAPGLGRLVIGHWSFKSPTDAPNARRSPLPAVPLDQESSVAPREAIEKAEVPGWRHRGWPVFLFLFFPLAFSGGEGCQRF